MTNPIQESLITLMADNSKLRRAQAQTRLETIGLHRGWHFALSILWEKEGVTHSELAERLFITPATMTNALKRMEKAGLIERRHDAIDQRVSRVYLTAAGRQIQAATEQVWRDFEQDIFTGFSHDEQAILHGFLLRMKENLLRLK
jgi:DNA-binding MarR family transcriptional regulator